MKYKLLTVALFSSLISGVNADTQCVDVPENYKIALLPWFVPTKELKWTWHPVHDPVQEQEESPPVTSEPPDYTVTPDDCPNGYTITPGFGGPITKCT